MQICLNMRITACTFRWTTFIALHTVEHVKWQKRGGEKFRVLIYWLMIAIKPLEGIIPVLYLLPSGLIIFWIRRTFLFCKRRNNTNVNFQLYNNVNSWTHRAVAEEDFLLLTPPVKEDFKQSTGIWFVSLNVFWKSCWQKNYLTVFTVF